MTKTIVIDKCKSCPHFTQFPAEYFDGDCTNIKMRGKGQDTRIVNMDSIPKWCPL